MKQLILERIRLLESRKQAEKRQPCHPTEPELRQDIAQSITEALDSLIEDGAITVTGITINKIRLLTEDKRNNSKISK